MSGDKLLSVSREHNIMRGQMDRRTSDLIAILLSDGSMHKHKMPDGSIRHRISFESVDTSVARKFQEVISEALGSKYSVHKRLPNNKNWSEVYYLSAIVPQGIERNLLRHSKTYRTRPFADRKFPESKIPDEIMSGTTEQKQSFLKLFASAEGSVILVPDRQRKWWVINRWISIRCTHPVISRQLRELLQSLNISSSGPEKEIIIKGEENLVKFQKFVGFIDGCRVTKKNNSKWVGTEKNKLLEAAILLYSTDKRCLKFAKTKEDVFYFLKSLLEARNAF